MPVRLYFFFLVSCIQIYENKTYTNRAEIPKQQSGLAYLQGRSLAVSQRQWSYRAAFLFRVKDNLEYSNNCYVHTFGLIYRETGSNCCHSFTHEIHVLYT